MAKRLTDEQRAKQRANYRAYYVANRERILASRRAKPRPPLTDEQRERMREYNRRYRQRMPPEQAEAQRQRTREWREAHRDEVNRRQREKLAALPEAEREAFRAKRRAYYRRNRERILERQRQYQYSHPEQVEKAIQRSSIWQKENAKRKNAYNRRWEKRRRKAAKMKRKKEVSHENLIECLYQTIHALCEAADLEEANRNLLEDLIGSGLEAAPEWRLQAAASDIAGHLRHLKIKPNDDPSIGDAYQQ